MKSFVRTMRFRLFLYTIFYFLFMSYGLDLVQSQGSQILPFIAWLKNPETFQNDLIGMTFPYYSAYSLWYGAAAWFSIILPPMGVIYVYFFVQCFLEVFGLHFLSRKLFPDLTELFNWTIIVLFTFGGVLRHSLGSVAPFGWTVFPDTLVTGIALFALGYLFEKRYLPAFFLTAIGFYFHLTVSLFLFIVFFVFYLSDLRSISLKQSLKTGLVFMIVVIPQGLLILNNPLPPPTVDFDTWFVSIRNFHGMHAFPSQFGLSQYIPFLFWVGLFLVSVNYLKNTVHYKGIIRFCVIAALLLLFTTVFTEIIPIKTVITFSFFRGSRFILIVSVLCSIALIFQMYARVSSGHYLRSWIPAIGIGVTAFFVFINILVFHPVYRVYPSFVKNIFENIEQTGGSARSSLLYQTLRLDRGHVAAWLDVQIWCKNNTQDDKLVLTPYYLRGFKSFSERGIVFQFRDSQLHIYHPIYDRIYERTYGIGKPMDQFKDLTEYQTALEDHYKRYTREDILLLAERYHFSFIVTEKKHTLALPLKYTNGYFNVYSVAEED